MPYSRFDPERRQRRIQRLRQIPIRTLVPNVITLLALCAGLTGIRLAFEERYELALGAIVFAAMLDAVDGRVARMIKGTSRFGAELDSLADFVNFGVAPGLILYHWGLMPLGALPQGVLADLLGAPAVVAGTGLLSCLIVVVMAAANGEHPAMAEDEIRGPRLEQLRLGHEPDPAADESPRAEVIHERPVVRGEDHRPIGHELAVDTPCAIGDQRHHHRRRPDHLVDPFRTSRAGALGSLSVAGLPEPPSAPGSPGMSSGGLSSSGAVFA